jgi:cell wall assembly regulator SMI1
MEVFLIKEEPLLVKRINNYQGLLRKILKFMNNNLKIVIPNPPITEKDIVEAEKKIGIAFPNDYKNFLLKNNGGKIYYNSFDRILGDNHKINYSIEAFESLESLLEAWSFLKDDEFFKPAKLLPIAQTLGPTLIGISFVPDHYGRIFVFDWDFGSTFQANNIIEFLEQIKYTPEGSNYPLF